jgi:hypothetical protein
MRGFSKWISTNCGTTLVASVLLPSALLAQGSGKDKAPDLGRYKRVYEVSLASIEKKYADKQKAVPKQYLAALQALRKTMQNKGDLEGWKAVSTEVKRFAADRKIKAPESVEMPEELLVLRKKYAGLPTEHRIDRNKEILLLAKQYTQRLTKLQTQYTKAGKMQIALAVNAELKRVQSSAEVSAAEFELADIEAGKKQEAKPGDREGPQDETAQAAPPPDATPEAPDGVKLYAPGPKPSAEASRGFRRLSLYPSGNASPLRKISVYAHVAERTEFSAARKKNIPRTHIRLTVRSTSARFEGGTLVVQAFGSLASSRVSRPGWNSGPTRLEGGSAKPSRPPELMETQRIPLPSIGQQDTCIDCRALPDDRAIRRNPFWGTVFDPWKGREFYGAVVSVYSGDGSLAYQGASPLALKSLAPAGPLADTGRTRHEAGDAGMKDGDVAAPAASPEVEALRQSYQRARLAVEWARKAYRSGSSVNGRSRLAAAQRALAEAKRKYEEAAGPGGE